jgi:hypothetical protein
MKKIKYVTAALVLTIIYSSCGVFKTDCHCPHFGSLKPAVHAKIA